MSRLLRFLMLEVFVVLGACKSGAQDDSETDSAGDATASIGNPTGTCVAPDDGSRAGYSSTGGLTWLPDCRNPLRREYWRVFSVSADRAAMLPRPDGSPRLGAPCNGPQHPLASIVQKYGLCDSAMTAEQVATINAMSIPDAFAVARYLQAQLVFVVTPDGLGIDPFPIPSDILDACKLHGDGANSPDLGAICKRESDRLQSGDEIGFTYTGPGAVELVARLNELYGIRIETVEAGTCLARQERNSADASFIYLAGAVSPAAAPECVPTCPVQPADGTDAIASLPAGGCQPATSPCDMSAARSCGCASFNAPHDSYRCACVDARWECVITGKSHGICLPCEGGASADDAAAH